MNNHRIATGITIRLGDWQQSRHDAEPIRFAVFVQEQQVPAEIELDAHDAQSIHAVAYAQGQAVATGRLLPDGHIGRMAVLPSWRGSGVGSQLLQALVDHALANGYASLALSAQCHARPFYERHGFVAEGEPYEDAGITHIAMRRTVGP